MVVPGYGPVSVEGGRYPGGHYRVPTSGDKKGSHASLQKSKPPRGESNRHGKIGGGRHTTPVCHVDGKKSVKHPIFGMGYRSPPFRSAAERRRAETPWEDGVSQIAGSSAPGRPFVSEILIANPPPTPDTGAPPAGRKNWSWPGRIPSCAPINRIRMREERGLQIGGSLSLLPLRENSG